MHTTHTIVRTGHLRTALLILLAALALGAAGASASFAVEDTATQDDTRYETRRECRDARPLDVARIEWECFGSNANGWVGERVIVFDSFGTPSPTSSSGGGGFLALAFLWSGIPLMIAATMASNRGESMGIAVGLTLFLGWIGLAIVWFGQRETVSAARGLADTGQQAAAARQSTAPQSGATWPSAPPTEPDASGRLKSLEELLDQGLISDSEYDTQRRRILDNI